MSTEIKRLEFELEKACSGLAMPYDRERAQLREARKHLRMRKAKQMAAKLRLKLSTERASFL
jgi:hypothetical protein